jgi:hydroxymethylpyrimidine/phosphomethylpyrimidine kinase
MVKSILIDELMQESLFSNNTACLSPKLPIYYPNAMELILRSPIVQHQVQQRMAKTAQEKITDPELKRILIPCLDSALMIDLEKLCLDSKNNYFASKKLLEQAKSRVEQLIEEAAAR